MIKTTGKSDLRSRADRRSRPASPAVGLPSGVGVGSGAGEVVPTSTRDTVASIPALTSGVATSTDVVVSLVDHAADGSLGRAAGASLVRLAFGFGIALPLGVLAGLGLAWTNKTLTDGSIAVIASSEPTTPPTIAINNSQTAITLSWPTAYTSFTLRGQTNPVTIGLRNNWGPVSGVVGNQVTIPINPANGCVFFQLFQQ